MFGLDPKTAIRYAEDARQLLALSPGGNGSSTAGATAQDATSASATDSIKHATSMTQKASARSRQEHKTTISTTTVTGAEESSTRVLVNSSTTDPIRIDYFSLMRKWRVRLYRFGLRLTYDMVVLEPGAAMRRAYRDLDVRGRVTAGHWSRMWIALPDNGPLSRTREAASRSAHAVRPVPG